MKPPPTPNHSSPPTGRYSKCQDVLDGSPGAPLGSTSPVGLTVVTPMSLAASPRTAGALSARADEGRARAKSERAAARRTRAGAGTVAGRRGLGAAVAVAGAEVVLGAVGAGGSARRAAWEECEGSAVC